MTGRWVMQDSEHHCDKPSYGPLAIRPDSPKIQVGDIWICDVCGMAHQVGGLSFGDQRDPIPNGYITFWKTKID